jgi:FlaG/FlaF family flagellin (archaellin)
MHIEQLVTDETAVSPVIGVVLMVSITVVLAAVVGVFALGFADRVPETAPNAQLDFEYTTAPDGDRHVNISHAGGTSLRNETLTLSGDGVDDSGAEHWGVGASGPYTAGEELYRSAMGPDVPGTTDATVTPGATVEVVWTAPGGRQSNIIAESTVP